MNKELIIKKCNKCGAIIRVIQDCKNENCEITCCGEKMKTMIPNSVDAAVEKHIPSYEVEGDKIKVKVNHVMDEDHFIEWITIQNEDKEKTVYLEPGKSAETQFCYHKGAVIYAYCNKHGLWKKEVE